MTLLPTACPKPPVRPKKAPRRLQAKGGARFKKGRDPEYRRWVRTENPCLLGRTLLRASVSPRDQTVLWGGASTGSYSVMLNHEGFWHVCWGPREAAHVGKTVARGANDVGVVVCLCRAAHRFYDEHRDEWRHATGYSERDMESAASGLGLRYVERGGLPVTHPEKGKV